MTAVFLDGLAERVADAAGRVGRALASDGGSIDVKEVTADGRVVVRLGGACVSCPLRPLTMAWLVRPALLEVEGVREVDLCGFAVSEFAEARIRRAFGARLEGEKRA